MSKPVIPSATLSTHPDWLLPEGLPPEVGACMTTRAGGCSEGPYASMNLGEFVGDDPAAVAHNRTQLVEQMGARAVFLQQVHGARVVRVTAQDAWPGAAPLHQADACVTTEPRLACVVQTADCLPVLFASAKGAAVGAAHAGWRGLAGGVLEQTLQAVCEAAGCQPAEVSAWLGACIGPDEFEVGADVLEAFGATAVPGQSAPFFKAQAHERWLADLAGLARQRLTGAGVVSVSGGIWPTHGSRFFSFRRDRGVTGRMGAAIWIRG